MRLLEREREVTGIYLSGHPLNQFIREIRAFCNCRVNNIEKYVNHELNLAAIVVSADHRTAQSGSKYGRFVIEDYGGQYEISLYRDDYLKHKHMFEEGSLLFIKAVNKPHNFIKGRVDFKILELCLLEELKQKAKAIDITLPLEKIDDDFIAKMEELCTTHPGLMKVNMQVRSDGHLVYLMAIEKTLAFDKAMFEALEEIGIEGYKINSN